jgi:hypothetical protein
MCPWRCSAHPLVILTVVPSSRSTSSDAPKRSVAWDPSSGSSTASHHRVHHGSDQSTSTVTTLARSSSGTSSPAPISRRKRNRCTVSPPLGTWICVPTPWLAPVRSRSSVPSGRISAVFLKRPVGARLRSVFQGPRAKGKPP